MTSCSAGNVVVWSDTDTIYQGHITAKGGETRGDGGNVEVSGYQNLNFRGTADLSAPHGRTGSLLLDPTTITITATDSSASPQMATYMYPISIAAPVSISTAALPGRTLIRPPWPPARRISSANLNQKVFDAASRTTEKYVPVT